MKIQLLLITFVAGLSSVALGMKPSEQPAKETADISTPKTQPNEEQFSDEELAKLRQQLESIGQMPAEEETTEEAMPEQPMIPQEMPETKPAEMPTMPQEPKEVAAPTEETTTKAEGIKTGMVPPAGKAEETKPMTMPGEEQEPMAKPAEEMPSKEAGLESFPMPSPENEEINFEEETEEMK